uniref:Uncharacterized protein n=1 Tax=Oryza rufipogon TaxID=4529 RepID=A0A0E0P827_ORYRU
PPPSFPHRHDTSSSSPPPAARTPAFLSLPPFPFPAIPGRRGIPLHRTILPAEQPPLERARGDSTTSRTSRREGGGSQPTREQAVKSWGRRSSYCSSIEEELNTGA